MKFDFSPIEVLLFLQLVERWFKLSYLIEIIWRGGHSISRERRIHTGWRVRGRHSLARMSKRVLWDIPGFLFTGRSSLKALKLSTAVVFDSIFYPSSTYHVPLCLSSDLRFPIFDSIENFHELLSLLNSTRIIVKPRNFYVLEGYPTCVFNYSNHRVMPGLCKLI